MDNREAIEHAFVTLVMQKDYEKITVTEICELAKVARKAFYSKFESKEDIIASLFEKHATSRSKTLNDMFSLDDLLEMEMLVMSNFYKGLYEEREYYMALVGSPLRNSDTFLRVATKCMYKLDEELLPRLGSIGEGWKADYTLYYLAVSQAAYMEKWIRDKFPVPPQQLAEHFMSITAPFWHSFVEANV